MAYFKLDVYKTEELISEFKSYKNNYTDDLDLLFGSLDGVESCWNDTNSPVFKDIVRKDKEKIDNYLSNIDLLCNRMTNFNDELKKIVSSFGFSSNKCIVKFDDGQIDDCKNKLSNVVYYLNNALYTINNKLLYSTYKNKNHLYYLRNQLYGAVNITNEIKSNFEKYVNSMTGLLEKYNEQINNIDDLDLELKKIEFKSNVVDLS